MRLGDLSIKWKLVLTIMLVSMTALIVAGALFFTHQYSAVQNLIKRDLQAIANVSAANSTAALSFDDPKAAVETLAALQAKSIIEAACLYDREGKLFAVYHVIKRRA
jgi:hypothetical protein